MNTMRNHKTTPSKRWMILLFFSIVCISNIDAQISRLKRANKYYSQHKYAKAIPLYKREIAKNNTNSTIIKLAYSYSYINQHIEANKYYEMALTSKNVNPKIYLNYANSLIASGNPTKANEILELFSDTNVEETTESLALVLACTTRIPAYFHVDSVFNININTKYNENSPVFHNDRIVFSSDRPSGILKLKSRTSGHGLEQIYSIDEKGKIKRFSALNKGYLNTANASFDSTGTKVFYTQNNTESNKSNIYSMQLFSAHLEDGHWIKDGILPFCRKGHNYMHPAISPDGKHLYFVSDKLGGEGGTDIYVVHQTKKGWSKPENLGSKINTSSNEGFPFIDTDYNLYFCSKGHAGYGGYDIFISKTLDLKEFSTPTNLGAPINSYGDDISFSLSKDKKKGLFSSSRNNGDDDVFLVEIK